MSGSSDAADTLRQAVAAPLAPVGSAVAQARAAQVAFQGADDLVAVMGAAADVILACEHLAEVAAQAEKAARGALGRAMAETGATTIQRPAHTISLRDASRTVIVTDLATVPAEFMRQPPPAPDKVAIGKLLRDGRSVTGCALSNGGDPVVQIRTREGKAV